VIILLFCSSEVGALCCPIKKSQDGELSWLPPFSAEIPQNNQLLITLLLQIVRGILLKGNGRVEVWPNLWLIILFMLEAMTLAMMRYRETLD
jgi:hypothetical protein